MDKVIKQGYLIEVTTWENDGDNYKTAVVEGLDVVPAKILREYCQLFSSENAHTSPGFGNSANNDSTTELLEEALATICAKYSMTVEVLESFEEDSGTSFCMEEMYHDLIGDWCEGDYRRVVESVHLYYNSGEIVLKEV